MSDKTNLTILPTPEVFDQTQAEALAALRAVNGAFVLLIAEAPGRARIYGGSQLDPVMFASALFVGSKELYALTHEVATLIPDPELRAVALADIEGWRP